MNYLMYTDYITMEESFKEITGCETIEEATKWINLASNDLDNAVTLYFASKDEDQMDQQINEDIKENCIFEDEIRKPDKVKREILYDPYSDFSNYDKKLKTDMPESVNPTPTHLKYKGDFEKAKKSSIKYDKLLMVNIQTKTNLESMNLNRDIWADDEISEIIKEKYIFLQIYSDNPKAVTILSNYNIYDLPTVMIIDPLTGLLLWKNENIVEKFSFKEKIKEFKPREKFSIDKINNLSIKQLLFNYKEKEITDKIVLNVSLQSKRIKLESCKKFNLLQLAKQFAKLINDENSEINNFDVYYDFPQKHLLEEMKKYSKERKGKIPLIEEFNFTNFRFFIKYLEDS